MNFMGLRPACLAKFPIGAGREHRQPAQGYLRKFRRCETATRTGTTSRACRPTSGVASDAIRDVRPIINRINDRQVLPARWAVPESYLSSSCRCGMLPVSLLTPCTELSGGNRQMQDTHLVAAHGLLRLRSLSFNDSEVGGWIFIERGQLVDA